MSKFTDRCADIIDGPNELKGVVLILLLAVASFAALAVAIFGLVAAFMVNYWVGIVVASVYAYVLWHVVIGWIFHDEETQ